jgi:hypothetical protein
MTQSIRLVVAVGLCCAWALPTSARDNQKPSATLKQAPSSAAAQKAGVPAHAVQNAAESLAGDWRAPQERSERYSQLDIEVFGPHAFDVRDVDLKIQPSGDGVLKVSTKVVDQKGKTYSPAVIEAKLHIGAAEKSVVGLLEPVVTVVSAEERYLDGSGDHWSRNGAQIQLTAADLSGDELNLRFDPPGGRGSFGATLKRQRTQNR